jgi:hypothetical protein
MEEPDSLRPAVAILSSLTVSEMLAIRHTPYQCWGLGPETVIFA